MNLHATALVIGEAGVLLTGPSGSGKTTLALELIARSRSAGRFASLVADDQLIISAQGGRLVAAAPLAISGLVEVRGSTPQQLRWEPGAVIDLLLKLVPQSSVPRYAEPARETISGLELPVLVLAERNVMGSLAAVAARLGLAPFV